MELQLADTSDIVRNWEMTPPTKRLMHWKNVSGVEKLFSMPGRSMSSKKIMKVSTWMCTNVDLEEQCAVIVQGIFRLCLTLENYKKIYDAYLQCKYSVDFKSNTNTHTVYFKCTEN